MQWRHVVVCILITGLLMAAIAAVGCKSSAEEAEPDASVDAMQPDGMPCGGPDSEAPPGGGPGPDSKASDKTGGKCGG